jgi:hypothetical protein
MVVSIRSRLMIAAMVFALAWALGFAVHHAVHMSLAVLCLAIGSLALSYLVWEYHRAWRLRPSNVGSTAALGLRTWPGISVDGVIVRPEYITAGLSALCERISALQAKFELDHLLYVENNKITVEMVRIG